MAQRQRFVTYFSYFFEVLNQFRMRDSHAKDFNRDITTIYMEVQRGWTLYCTSRLLVVQT